MECGALTLGIEEASHPEDDGSSAVDPGRELCVSLEQLREPEAERGRRPRDAVPDFRHAGIVHVVQSIA